ncbi:MAG: hypothetical protein K0S04_2317 [Herbinix sp.]|nr:hypothetical protein [Herbinix sp.]
MKLKYKKVILITTMSTMGIGILTLSLSQNRTHAEEKVNSKLTTTAVMTMDTTVESEEDSMSALAADLSVSPMPTIAATPTPLPVYDVKEDGYPKILKMFKEYYTAKGNCDVKGIKKLLSDPSKVETQDELQEKTKYIEKYEKIKAYVKNSFEKNSYVVYVYHEIKFTNISTTIPGLSRFYVVTDADGNLKIFSGDMDAETKSYYDDRMKDEDVIALFDMTNDKSEAAMKKDEDLQNFVKRIQEAATNAEDTKSDSTKSSTTKSDTTNADATKTSSSKNASIGITAIKAVLDKTENQNLNNELHKQLKDYQTIAAKSKNQLLKNGTKVKKQSLYVKAMMKGNVKMNTIMRPSDSSIAQMVIQGSTMGVTQMTKLIHAKPNADGICMDIAKEFVKREENNIEVMKNYL